MCTRFNFAMRPKHLLCTEHSIDGGKWSANIWRLWGGENGEWQRPETAASVTSVSREMGRPRAFYQLTARSPAWRRHVTLVTCHVSILILQTLSTRLGNYWFVRHSTGMVTWLLSYMLQLALCSHFILVTFCTSTPYHLEYLHTYRIVVYVGQCQWNAAHLSQLCQSSKCGLVRFYAACCFKHFVFFGARHRPGRFSSRVSNFDIEFYINIHNI